MRWPCVAEALMICEDCAAVADAEASPGYTVVRKTWKGDKSFQHCDDGKCPCQHKPIGSWNGGAVGALVAGAKEG